MSDGSFSANDYIVPFGQVGIAALFGLACGMYRYVYFVFFLHDCIQTNNLGPRTSIKTETLLGRPRWVHLTLNYQ